MPVVLPSFLVDSAYCPGVVFTMSTVHPDPTTRKPSGSSTRSGGHSPSGSPGHVGASIRRDFSSLIFFVFAGAIAEKRIVGQYAWYGISFD